MPVSPRRSSITVDPPAGAWGDLTAKRLLEREGVQVVTAHNGADAVRIFRQYADQIALVLMDLTMPEMDGEQAFHAIRSIRSDAVVVLSSGFSEAEAAERLRGFGLAGFVRKPYTRKVLLNEIARLGVVDVSAIEQEPLQWI